MNSHSDLVSALQAAVAKERISWRGEDLDTYSRDLWPRFLLATAGRQPMPSRPQLVVWPKNAAEVQAVLRLCAAHRVPVVPYGAGSGVTGGAVGPSGSVVLDTKQMRAVQIDAQRGVVTFEPGIMGWHLEERLNRQGLSLGHFPSSIMCSTAGGWLATRGAGQMSTKYGKIEDMVRSLELCTGTGERLQLNNGDCGGIDWAQLAVGSEGTLGVITSATCAVRKMPAARRLRGYSFPSVEAACFAISRLLQRGLRPAVVRLYDEIDTLLSGMGRHGETKKGSAGVLGPSGPSRGMVASRSAAHTCAGAWAPTRSFMPRPVRRATGRGIVAPSGSASSRASTASAAPRLSSPAAARVRAQPSSSRWPCAGLAPVLWPSTTSTSSKASAEVITDDGSLATVPSPEPAAPALLPVDRCPSCGATDHRPVLPAHGGIALVRCSACGLVFATAGYAPRFLDDHYADRARRAPPVDAPSVARPASERKRHSLELYDRLTGGRLCPAPPGGLALDIGCGPGLLLDLLREAGWGTVGIERSPAGEEAIAAGHRVLAVDIEVDRTDLPELAARVLVSRSRLTYRVDRLEERGLVIRENCETDRRGFIARLTPAGRQLLVEVAPHHVAGVRARLVDRVDREEFLTLGRIVTKVLGYDLDAEPRQPVGSPA